VSGPQYEYEEDLHLRLDGSATLYVNSSIAGLDALRGTKFDLAPAAPVDRASVRGYFASPVTRVTRLNLSRRQSRRFVHLRIEVDDVTRLPEAAPFAWSSYRFSRAGETFEYRQLVGASAGVQVGQVGWTGRELVGFRLHVPSRVVDHNAGDENLRRGNILVWEQPLTDRLRGDPLALHARLETRSILSRTLVLFATALGAVATVFAVIIWWMIRRGERPRDVVRQSA
jgi:hypothetical protein